MKRTNAFLFDMDGVIIDSNPVHKIALKEFCQKYGFDLTDEQLHEKIYGRTNKDWIPLVFGELTREQITQYGDEKEAMFRKLFEETIRPLDGLIEFLEKLDHHNLDRAIATSAPRENVDFTLSKTGTTPYFKTILDESNVEKGKPDPEIYLKTARALGHQPEECVVFEDSLAGVKSGKAAGCKVVAIATTHTAEELHEADLVFDNFVGLEPLELLSRLF